MTKRKKLKRKAAQALHNTDKATVDIAELQQIFDDGHHEEYVKLLETIIGQYVIARQLIERFWEYAWGPLPDNPDVYRG